MASGRLVIPSWMPALDSDGVPIPNASIYFYVNRTTTLATIYSDEALSVPMANPVFADSSGQFPPIWQSDDLLFSASVDAPFGPPGQPFTFDDLAPSSSIGGASNKLDRDGGNPTPDTLDNLGAAPVTLDGSTTVPVSADATPPAASYFPRRQVMPQDMDSWNPAPGADNYQALVDAQLAASTTGGEVYIYGVIYCGSRIDLLPKVTWRGRGRLGGSQQINDKWSDGKSVIIFPNALSQCFLAFNVNDVTLSGFSVIKQCVAGTPTSIANYRTTVGLFNGDMITFDSSPDCRVEHMMMAGGNRPLVINGCERFHASWEADCLSGGDISGIFDTSDNFYAGGYPLYGTGWLRDYLGVPGSPGYAARFIEYSSCLVRPGRGLWFHKTNPGDVSAGDGILGGVIRMIGYRTGVEFEDTNAYKFALVWLDSIENMVDTIPYPAFGATYRPLGLVMAGNCQNTAIENVHINSHWQNYYSNCTPGTVGPIIQNMTHGTGVRNHMSLGGQGSTILNVQYAGNASDCSVEFRSGATGFKLDHIVGKVVTTPVPYKYVTPADALNNQIGQWEHNGVQLDCRPFASYAQYEKSSAQSIPAATWTTIGFNVIVADSLLEWNTGTNRLTFKADGLYQVSLDCGITPSSAAVSSIATRIVKNGQPYASPNQQAENLGGYTTRPIFKEIIAVAGDYLEFQAYCDAGAAVSNGGTAGYRDTNFLVKRLTDRRF